MICGAVVEQEVDLASFFAGVFCDHELLGSGGGAPVDVASGFALYVFAEAVEIGAGASDVAFLIAEAEGGLQDGGCYGKGFGKGEELLRGFEDLTALFEAERVAGGYGGAGDGVEAAAGEGGLVGFFGGAGWWYLHKVDNAEGGAAFFEIMGYEDGSRAEKTLFVIKGYGHDKGLSGYDEFGAMLDGAEAGEVYAQHEAVEDEGCDVDGEEEV